MNRRSRKLTTVPLSTPLQIKEMDQDIEKGSYFSSVLGKQMESDHFISHQEIEIENIAVPQQIRDNCL